MKPLRLLFSLAVITLLFSFDSPPSLFGDEITSAGSSVTQVTFTDPVGVSSGAPVTLYIKVDADNTGTIKFSKTSTVGASAAANAAGATIPLTVRATTSSGSVVVNLWYQASAADQSFVVTQ